MLGYSRHFAPQGQQTNQHQQAQSEGLIHSAHGGFSPVRGYLIADRCPIVGSPAQRPRRRQCEFEFGHVLPIHVIWEQGNRP